MSLALAALVLCSLSPSTVVTSASLGQKVQILKGKKGTVKAANAQSDATAVQVAPEGQAQGNTVKSQELDRKSAELDARNKELAEREQALKEKETSAAETDKKKAAQQEALKKHIEKIGDQNQQMMQQASDSLAGD